MPGYTGPPMALTSSITAYDPRWPQGYAEAAGQLAPILEPSLVEIHHVGSTAVPLLAAKPEIDILAIVRTSETPDSWLDSLGTLGFRRVVTVCSYGVSLRCSYGDTV
ncbi:GrpB family protein [Phenylobacterium sp.]|uniref:GrpB family protein n=1 Tax=Phenylobacterium sp. TaxID=1871053 RepID=UPI00273781D8|nr:GrpB family protein [Phenylobacterium sp.]MDP3868503.1 GrpB family protein [Phenylobacterium sp.]